MYILVESINKDLQIYPCKNLAEAIQKMRNKFFSFNGIEYMINNGEAGINEDGFGAWITEDYDCRWKIFAINENCYQ